MSGIERDVRHWIVMVSGKEVGYITPGQRVEIGRKPLRPLADTGIARIEVSDATRSMSKRHAIAQVLTGGDITLEDIGSTNGTFIVRTDGTLIRLPEHEAVSLPGSHTRVQFGDVVADLVRVEEDDEPQVSVTDLFDYALDNVPEPEAADLSVDDILDLRAGEPTSMFAAQPVHDASVGSPVSFPENTAINDSAVGFEESPEPTVPLTFTPATEHNQQPRDLFADAQSQQQKSDERPVVLPLNAEQFEPAVTQTPETQLDAEASSVPVETVNGEEQAVAGNANEIIEPAETENAGNTVNGENVEDTENRENVSAEAELSEQSENSDQTEQSEQSEQFGQTEQQENVQQYTAETVIPEEHEKYARTSAQPQTGQSQTTFTPAFEPGSVFERVSQGEFKEQENAEIEVGGYSSKDARLTRDFSVQFEMAKHEQLWPYLALNPALYDDLYAWLSSLGNIDIDSALEQNAGYQEYRKAVGKNGR